MSEVPPEGAVAGRCQPGDPARVEDDMRCGSESEGHYCGRWHWHPKQPHECVPCRRTWPGVERDHAGNGPRPDAPLPAPTAPKETQ